MAFAGSRRTPDARDAMLDGAEESSLLRRVQVRLHVGGEGGVVGARDEVLGVHAGFHQIHTA